MAFEMLLDRHGHFFRTRTRHNVAVARRYLRGLAQAEDCKFESMAAVVEGGCPQQFQHFISCSPWDHEPVVAQIGQDADRLLGGKPTSALIIDESSFPKQGDRSVGVARQWTGRLGKVDNCQVAVFGVLTDGERHTPIDARLYLPERWIEDPARCERAGIPEAAREKMSKSELALDIVRRARARGIRFAWVGVDGGYGKEPDFLRRLDDENETFVADVHRNQHVWTKEPGLHVPASKPGRGRPSKKPKPATASITVEKLAEGIPPEDWTRCILRDCTRGQLRVDITTRRIWVWDGKEERARCWHLIVRREAKEGAGCDRGLRHCGLQFRPASEGVGLAGFEPEPSRIAHISRRAVGGVNNQDVTKLAQMAADPDSLVVGMSDDNHDRGRPGA